MSEIGRLVNFGFGLIGRRKVDRDDVGLKKEEFLSNPQNVVLVSFPRTGSHWLRMLMEQYFRRPCLVRPFYYQDSDDFLACHTHDMDLNLLRKNVIYLYRNPVDTVYSQIQYHKEPLKSAERVKYWALKYRKHLEKWLVKESFCSKKSVVAYEMLRSDIYSEFEKITNHFDAPLDRDRLSRIALTVSKEVVKEKTEHDPQVIQISTQYEDSRKTFIDQNYDLVWGIILEKNASLEGYFSTQFRS